MRSPRLPLDDALALAGVLFIDVGCWLIWPPLAWIWAGLVLLGLGLGTAKTPEPPT